MSYENLAGRTAVVTGAASGIGEAIAVRLAAEGAKVALLARRAERLDAVAEKIRADGGQALAVVADVTDDASVATAVERIHAAYGTVDLVVNNAGIALMNAIEDAPAEESQRMIDTNVTGVVRVTSAFAKDLTAAAAQGRSADLVNISSIAAHLTGFQGIAVYGATKAAVTQLSALLRGEFGPRDVRVTNIEPGVTETEIATHVEDDGMREQLAGLVEAFGALAPAELADVVAYVTSRPRHMNLRQLMVLPTRQV
ncbi:SDR family oxidoreductase [Streptomyces cyaneochromogenes]|uniref:SDR family oxidoreductase n=1 Tax=Streptomyces cyaneochromogenes TaxID=2496836 RepID=A0A3Q9ETI1_9ACTN|nr:SDR family oxidoreductase [Streptomyces cyaneochromogenes]AZQ35248.1 SDR family oxidoreductase [Streptomyces cyaneochromogenes]